MKTQAFEPRVICFLCNWCAYAGADLAGTSRMEYVPNGIPIRVMCSSRVAPEHILSAFQRGADGVFIGGCHPGDCHYQSGNYKTRRRILLLKKILADLGISPQRLRLEWISASQAGRFVQVMNEFVREMENLGPLNPDRIPKDEGQIPE